jgi:hypothetical protein
MAVAGARRRREQTRVCGHGDRNEEHGAPHGGRGQMHTSSHRPLSSNGRASDGLHLRCARSSRGVMWMPPFAVTVRGRAPSCDAHGDGDTTYCPNVRDAVHSHTNHSNRASLPEDSVR